MSDKRAVITVEKAIAALPDQEKVVGFLLVEERGMPKRLLDEHRKEEIIGVIEGLGGCDVSGETFLKMGFGLAFPLPTPQGPRWFFVETRKDFCPFCQGEGKVVNVAELEIVSEACWVCRGEGVRTAEIPRRKMEEVLQ